jgi:hypothetical protein
LRTIDPSSAKRIQNHGHARFRAAQVSGPGSPTCPRLAGLVGESAMEADYADTIYATCIFFAKLALDAHIGA